MGEAESGGDRNGGAPSESRNPKKSRRRGEDDDPRNSVEASKEPGDAAVRTKPRKKQGLPPAQHDALLEQRANIVQGLLRSFKPERIVYLLATIGALGAEIYLVASWLRSSSVGWEQLSVLIGPTGFILFSSQRLLTMFNRAVRAIGLDVQE